MFHSGLSSDGKIKKNYIFAAEQRDDPAASVLGTTIKTSYYV
jgi:hypothetical protein